MFEAAALLAAVRTAIGCLLRGALFALKRYRRGLGRIWNATVSFFCYYYCRYRS